MKKSAIALSLALCFGVSAVHAGPKSFTPAGDGSTDDGRAYEEKIVNCSGGADHELRYFQDNRKWCLADESYCSRHIMKAAKKACRS